MIKMVQKDVTKWVTAAIILAAGVIGIVAQGPINSPVKSQEISDVEGIPVLIKHLPDWENVRNSAVFVDNAEDLNNALGARPVLELIHFAGGTEAVTAAYPAGKLLIVEYTNPQSSSEADAKIRQNLTESAAPVVYRRIGNYNTFVFDAADEAAANSLLDEIKYQKTVQWLGEDPYLLQKLEKYFITTTRDIFISTVLWIIGGLGIAMLTGILAGFVFFRFREQKRATRTAYSDAGGLTRLNLDGLSE